eukprot:COSAG06_NODE_1350_length_9768_cov_3.944151_2_plen_1041_part_00
MAVRRKKAVREIFSYYDVGQDGKLDQAEYEQYLRGIGSWGRGSYMPETWDERWLEETADMGCDKEGVTREAFETILYVDFRAAKVQADLAAIWNANPLDVADDTAAQQYVEQVRVVLGDTSKDFSNFLAVLHSWKTIGASDTIRRVTELLRGHTELILAFNTFLPAGHKISESDLEDVQLDDKDATGTLPVGVCDWECVKYLYRGTVYHETKSVTVSLLSNDDAATAIQREEETARAAAANAWGQLTDVAAIRVHSNDEAGKTTPRIGVYTPSADKGECPCFENENGYFLWYTKTASGSSWHISGSLSDDTLHTTKVSAQDGKLPIGSTKWSTFTDWQSTFGLSTRSIKLEVTLLSGADAVRAIEQAKSDKADAIAKLIADSLAQLAEIEALQVSGFPTSKVYSREQDCTVEVSSFNGTYITTGETTARGFPVYKNEKEDEGPRFLYARLRQHDTIFGWVFNTKLAPADPVCWAKRSSTSIIGSVPIATTDYQYFDGQSFADFKLTVRRRYKYSVDVASRYAKKVAELKAKGGLAADLTIAELTDALEFADGDVQSAHTALLEETAGKARVKLLLEAALQQAADEDTLVVSGFPTKTISKFRTPVELSSFNGKYTHTEHDVTPEGFPVWRSICATDGSDAHLGGRERVMFRHKDHLQPYSPVGWCFKTVLNEEIDPDDAPIWAWDKDAAHLIRSAKEPAGAGAMPVGENLRWNVVDEAGAGSFEQISLTVSNRKLRSEQLVTGALLGHTDEVLRLLDEGVDIEHVDEHGGTATYYAAKTNHIGVLKALIAAGAAIDGHFGNDRHSFTPLASAIQNSNFAAAECLLGEGADWRKLVTKDGDTVFVVATQDGKALLRRWVLMHGTEQHKVSMQEALFRDAASTGQVEEVQRMLREGMDVNVVDAAGTSALFMAARYGHVEIVRTLIAAGATIDAAVATSWEKGTLTPLMTAARQARPNSPKVVQVLLEAGADWRRKNGEGHTALDRAKQYKNKKTIKVLKAWAKASAPAPSPSPPTPSDNAAGGEDDGDKDKGKAKGKAAKH